MEFLLHKIFYFRNLGHSAKKRTKNLDLYRAMCLTFQRKSGKLQISMKGEKFSVAKFLSDAIQNCHVDAKYLFCS